MPRASPHEAEPLQHVFKTAGSERNQSGRNLPVELFERNRDLEVVSQHMEGCEDVGPLHHLTQGTPLQHFGAEDIPRLLCQKAHVN